MYVKKYLEKYNIKRAVLKISSRLIKYKKNLETCWFIYISKWEAVIQKFILHW